MNKDQGVKNKGFLRRYLGFFFGCFSLVSVVVLYLIYYQTSGYEPDMVKFAREKAKPHNKKDDFPFSDKNIIDSCLALKGIKKENKTIEVIKIKHEFVHDKPSAKPPETKKDETAPINYFELQPVISHAEETSVILKIKDEKNNEQTIDCNLLSGMRLTSFKY